MKHYVKSLSVLIFLAPLLCVPVARAEGPRPYAAYSPPSFDEYSISPLFGGNSIQTFWFPVPAADAEGAPEISSPAPLAGHSISGYRFFEGPTLVPAEDTSGEPSFGSALTDYESGRYAQAARAASSMVRTFAGYSPWEGRAAFLAGRAYARMKDLSSASYYFKLAKQKCPSLADYTLYILAGHYADGGLYEDEARTYMQLVREYPESPLAPESAVSAADAYLSLGRYQKAIDALGSPRGGKTNAALAAKSLYIRMTSHYALGDARAASSEYRALWLTYPEFSLSAPSFKVKAWSGEDYMQRGDAFFEKGLNRQALECYREAARKLPKKSPLRGEAYVKMGGTYFKLKENDKAEEALRGALSGRLPNEKTPEALYLLAKTYLRSGEREKFRETAVKCARHYPYDPLADDCLYLLGTTMSQEGQFDTAIETFKRLLADFPDSEKRDESLWQMGWAFYKKGDYRGAERVMGRLASEFPDSVLAPQAIYWRGKSLEALGETASAQAHYNELAQRYGLSFYGLLAGRKDLTLINPASWEEPKAVEVQEEPRVIGNCRRDPRLSRVYELAVQGMRDRAARELRAAEADYSDSIEGLETIAGLYDFLGDYRRPLELASRIYKTSLGTGKGRIPDEVLRMLFPLRYWTTINLEAYALRLDPMLISGVIREESHYNPSAVSPVGAVGLMQLMPATARLVCKKLDIGTAPAEELKNCDFNVPIGARYLDSLVKKHKGRLAHALAEYNAGPGNLEKWEKKNPGAPDDVFIENIEFMETRNYVKRVLRNYYMYKKLYGGEKEEEKAAL